MGGEIDSPSVAALNCICLKMGKKTAFAALVTETEQAGVKDNTGCKLCVVCGWDPRSQFHSFGGVYSMIRVTMASLLLFL